MNHTIAALFILTATACQAQPRAEPEILRTVASQCVGGISVAMEHGQAMGNDDNPRWLKAFNVYHRYANQARALATSRAIMTHYNEGAVTYEAIAVYADTCAHTALGR